MSTLISSLVHQTTTTAGAGAQTLAAVNARRTFNTAFGTGGSDVFYYALLHRTVDEWEYGTGHLSSSTVLVRDTVIASSNANTTVTFTAGTLDVINDLPAQFQVSVADLVAGYQPLDATLTTLAAVALVQGDLIYGSGTDVAARLAKDANATRYVSNQGTSNSPSWNQVNLTNGVTGTLPVANLPVATTTEVLTGTSTAVVASPDAIAALWEKGSNVASAGTVSFGEGGYFHVTGTTTITDIDFATAKDGRWAWVVFDGALILTHNATTLILPTAANITTVAGDRALFIQDATDNVYCAVYQRATGAALVGGGSSIVTDATPPGSPADGDAWYDLDSGAFYVYVNDGTSSQWIEVGGANFAIATDSTPPTSPGDGAAWYDLDTGGLFVYVNDGDSSQWVQVGGGGVSAVPQGHLWGLTLANNGTDASNDIDVAVGVAASSDSPYPTMRLTSAITKRVDANWAVGTNQGGTDTGTITTDTFHVFLIMRSDTGVVDVLFSISPTSPTMPTNYDYKRRIGSLIRTASVNVSFVQSGDLFARNTYVRDIDATNPGTSAVTRTLASVPTDIVVEAFIIYSIYWANAADSRHIVSPLDQTDQTPGAGVYDLITRAGSDDYYAIPRRVKTNTSAQIRTRQSVSGASDECDIIVLGWYDDRGRTN